ncbi:uncharacterized protein JCM6883_006182 [Sporobolomyces salmoneus]|uniref:uncharacterized protein n=1 Tax=Sporobolomyces salmoneus TaxID=183962 RepID=UPI00316D846E
MPRKTKFSNDSSDEEDADVEQQQIDQKPSTTANGSPLKPLDGTATNGNATPKKRTAPQVNGNGSGATGSNKKPRLVGFTESDEEDAKSTGDKDSLLHLGGLARTGTGQKRQLMTNEQRKKLKEEVQRLLPGRKELPVWEGKEEILKQVQENDTVVVLGETGSGKTTQIPQFLMRSSVPCEAPRIVCTQPRRVAATSLASRVSAEVGCPLGTLVGYTVRFDDRSSNKTRLKYATDGALLAEMLGDKDLENYDVVVLDEAHERSLRTDMLMGFLKDIQARRKEKVKEFRKSKGKGKQAEQGEGKLDRKGAEREPTELKIVVMSATIDAKRFSEFFDNAPVLFVKGRQHKVTLHYTTEPQTDYIDAALKTVFQIHTKYPPGAILVFLPGQDEIESLAASIKQFLPDLPKSFPKADSVVVTPLYAKLPAAEQALAFLPSPPNTRKIILATNVAETSVTLPGVKYVVDCGVAKEKRYHADVGIDSLTIEGISQSSAKQRAGRAGRESDGHCFRLYTEPDFLSMPQRTEPEIKRVSLTFALLHLMAAGQEDVSKFHYMDKPDRDALMFALLTLNGLGAINKKGKITPLGLQMAQLPLDPVYARVLIASFTEGCPNEAINLVALLGSKEQILAVSSANRDAANEARRKFVHRSGDHLTLLNILQAFEELEVNENEEAGRRQNERKQWCRENFISFKAMLQVLDARKQLRERCERLKIGDWRVSCFGGEDGRVGEHEPVLNSLVGGLFSNTAIRNEDGTYRHNITRQPIAIHPSSSMHNRKASAIVYDELVLTTKTYARGVSEIDPRSIRNKAPAVFASGKEER